MDPRTRDVNPGGDPEASDHIKWNIDRTRADMDQTLDELGRRLKPRRLMDDLVESVLGSDEPALEGEQMTSTDEGLQGTLGRIGGQAARSLGRHPLPAALIGAGVAWWIMDVQRSHRGQIIDEEFEPPYGPASYYGGSESEAQRESRMGRRMMSRARGAASSAGDKISSAASSAASGVKSAAGSASDAVRSAGSGIASAASDAAHRVTDASSRVVSGAGRVAREASHRVSSVGPALTHSVSSAGRQVSRGLSYSTRQVSSTMHDYPLASALALCGVGIGLGLLLPRTQLEDEWLGAQADQVKHKARQAGQQMMEQGREVASAGVAAATEALERKTSPPSREG
jgi:hypothetical protein